MKNGGRTLVAVPYLGEFGWELMNWQGRVRWLAVHGGYEQVIVCMSPDRQALYAMPKIQDRVAYCPASLLDLPGRANDDHRLDERGQPIGVEDLRTIAVSAARRACAAAKLDVSDATFLTPDYRSGLWPTNNGHQIFAELHQRATIDIDVVLAPRQRSLAPERNQPAEWWEELAGRLRNRGLTVQIYAAWFTEAVRQLSRARLAAGASTGGLHLASLCRCPHYVWGSGPEARWTRLNITNRQRYETIWNPFGTPCRYDECGWRPTLEHVEAETLRFLESIGVNRGERRLAWSFKPQWRIKRRLARLLEPGPMRGIVPWRLRQLVQEKVV